jgi:hypothetical protein
MAQQRTWRGHYESLGWAPRIEKELFPGRSTTRRRAGLLVLLVISSALAAISVGLAAAPITSRAACAADPRAAP